jgi:hypothetical protein
VYIMARWPNSDTRSICLTWIWHPEKQSYGYSSHCTSVVLPPELHHRGHYALDQSLPRPLLSSPHGSTSSYQSTQGKLSSPPTVVAVVRTTSCLYCAACCSCCCTPQHASLPLQLVSPAATVQYLLLAAFNALAASFVLELAAPYCHHVDPVQARLWFHNHQSGVCGAYASYGLSGFLPSDRLCLPHPLCHRLRLPDEPGCV